MEGILADHLLLFLNSGEGFFVYFDIISRHGEVQIGQSLRRRRFRQCHKSNKLEHRPSSRNKAHEEKILYMVIMRRPKLSKSLKEITSSEYHLLVRADQMEKLAVLCLRVYGEECL